VLVNLGLIHRDNEVIPYWDILRAAKPKIRDSNLISLPHALFRVFFCVGGERLVGKA